ncbi:hypothetical protein [Leptolyngbya sp. FACHB-261]|uniref:hypothetical protein n=1 Tax=Leptolyngbya sp. FACHB-261 TaxID=2692806 RepID=UPI001685208C|nr:hypothetical protein [Leptolyngbya sp. FACHB-261]MBD2104711.1 hypothetical protein [Leptolyngbya sp. FACHB-261]
MSTQSSNRRLSPQVISQDIDALNGLGAIPNYETARIEATSKALQAAYQAMIMQQQAETERQAMYRATVNAARLAEWNFHNAVLAMKEVVRGQFGSDSDEAQAVGLKKKSERKRRVRAKVVSA